MLTINHNAGFYSNCNIILHKIICFFNKNHKLPEILNTQNTFNWYKNKNESGNIFDLYFKNKKDEKIEYKDKIDYKQTYQFTDFKIINFEKITPFINKYFESSDIVEQKIDYIINKYNIKYDNICTLFHRGNDKITEMVLPSYDDYIKKGKEILHNNPDIVFLIQSDETEFLERMSTEFKNSIILYDEIRHINKNNKQTVDKINIDQNQKWSINFLAIIKIMSKTKYIICDKGNCSLFICLFRKNISNVIIL